MVSLLKNTLILFIVSMSPGAMTSVFAQERLTLKEFLDRVQTQNLDLKIESSKTDAANARATGISLPAPMAGVIQMKDATGEKTQGYEISQTVPFPTKVISDFQSRKYAAKSQAENRLAQKNEVNSQAKTLFISLWAAQEKIAILSEKKKILKEHLGLARSTARSDSFAAIHVVKAEYDFDFLDNEIAEAEQVLRSYQIEAALLINANPEQSNILVSEPPQSTLPKVEPIDSSHQLRAEQFNVESLRSEELNAKSSWFPEFNFRYKEVEASSMLPQYNEVMVGVSLPFVFFWQPYSESSAAQSERLAAEYNLEKRKRTLTGERAVLLSRAQSLKKQLDNLRKNLIPKAEKRMKLAHNLAPRDLETLQDHREAMEAFPDLKMRAIDLRIDYERTIFELEKYLVSLGTQ